MPSARWRRGMRAVPQQLLLLLLAAAHGRQGTGAHAASVLRVERGAQVALSITSFAPANNPLLYDAVMNSSVSVVISDDQALREAAGTSPEVLRAVAPILAGGASIVDWPAAQLLAGQRENAGSLRSLDDFAARHGLASTIPASMFNACKDPLTGTLYCIPHQRKFWGLAYNRVVWRRLELDPDTPPATWADFLDVCGAMLAAGVLPIAIPVTGDRNATASTVENVLAWFDYVSLRRWGAPLREQLAAGNASFAGGETRETLEVLRDLMRRGYMKLVGEHLRDVVDTLVGGGVGFLLTGDPRALGTSPDIDVFSFPTITEGIPRVEVATVDAWGMPEPDAPASPALAAVFSAARRDALAGAEHILAGFATAEFLQHQLTLSAQPGNTAAQQRSEDDVVRRGISIMETAAGVVPPFAHAAHSNIATAAARALVLMFAGVFDEEDVVTAAEAARVEDMRPRLQVVGTVVRQEPDCMWVALTIEPPPANGSGLGIYYTLDGSDPTPDSFRYLVGGRPVLMRKPHARLGLAAATLKAVVHDTATNTSGDVHMWEYHVTSGSAGATSTIVVLVLLIAIVLSVAVGVSRKASSALATAERLQEENELARQCAEAFADMRLQDVEYINNIVMPTPLTKAFVTILSNLNEYKLYLPALLTAERESEPEPSVDSASGLDMKDGSREVTICFTDVQGSTRHWQRAPIAMAVAVEIHNSIIRRALRAHNGCEVKTMGDSFMLAFKSVANAVAFATEVHCQLFACRTWPSELLADKQCDANNAWNGLHVRIGIYRGPAEQELNPVSDRYEYQGVTVRKAAKIEAITGGGAFCMSSTLMDDLRRTDAPLVARLHVTEMGSCELKGIGCMDLVLCVPRALNMRVSECVADMKLRQKMISERVSASPRPRNPLRTPVQRMPQHRFRPSSPHSSTDTDSVISGSDASSTLARDIAIEYVSRGTCCAVRFLVRDVSLLEEQDSFNHAIQNLSLPSRSLAMLPPAPDEGGEPVPNIIEAIRDAFSGVLVCLDRSKGAVLSLCNDTLVCGWGVTPKTQSNHHLQSCAEFVGAVGRYAPELPMQIAFCSGGVYSSSVGSGRQRCLSVFSPVVSSLSTMLHIATDYDVGCVHAVLPGHTALHADANFRPIVRALDFASIPPIAGTQETEMIVYQVRLEHLSAILNREDVGDAARMWAWSDSYQEAFENRDYRLIEHFIKDDPPLAVVVEAMRANDRTAPARYVVPFPLLE